MRPRTFEEPNSNTAILPVIINRKFRSARNCAVRACESCMLARAKNPSINFKKVKQKRTELCRVIKLRLEILFQPIICL